MLIIHVLYEPGRVQSGPVKPVEHRQVNVGTDPAGTGVSGVQVARLLHGPASQGLGGVTI